MPATASQMEQLIAEIKKMATEKAKTTNELSVQITSQYFSNKFGNGNKGELLKVYVERSNTTFNVYWKQLEEAAEYTVEIYKYVSMRWYKLTEISVDRNEGYIAISNLVGDRYVFRVVARNRSSEEIAKSAGTIIGSKTAE
jgi:phosphatidylethanolamine-binding protein (PEBP) family uncharacterized protein